MSHCPKTGTKQASAQEHWPTSHRQCCSPAELSRCLNKCVLRESNGTRPGVRGRASGCEVTAQQHVSARSRQPLDTCPSPRITAAFCDLLDCEEITDLPTRKTFSRQNALYADLLCSGLRCLGRSLWVCRTSMTVLSSMWETPHAGANAHRRSHVLCSHVVSWRGLGVYLLFPHSRPLWIQRDFI